MAGLRWKRNAREILERRRRFFRREMQDSALATLPVHISVQVEWRDFERRWPQYAEGEERPLPCHEEVFQRHSIGLEARGQVEDDRLPVVYSTLDTGAAGCQFGGEIHFFHQHHDAIYSATLTPTLPDYSGLGALPDPMASPWTARFLDLQRYFAAHMGDRFAQHPCLTSDALNFACDLRGSTQAYTDIYEHPEELRALLEIPDFGDPPEEY